MEKPTYPTDSYGLPVIPDETACYEVCLKGATQKNKHHLFNRSEANTALERRFCNAPSMVIRMCMCRHEDLHATYAPPETPTRAVMQAVIDGELAPVTASEAGVTVNIRTKAQINEENCYGQ
jgi:hypothetical protein